MAIPDFHRRWAALRPPQRPAPQVVTAMRSFFENGAGMALQLGVTPEIAALPPSSVAVDWDAAMIRAAWPGNTSLRRAILGNWLALPLADDSVDLAFGDGCLTLLEWPHDYRLLMTNLARVLRPGGRLLMRCFVAPDSGEVIEAVCSAAMAGTIASFGAFKLRFSMAVATETGAVTNSGAAILAAFDRHFPDRPALARATGWTPADIATMDAYAGGQGPLSYPTRAGIIDTLPPGTRCRFVDTEGYPMAERCPLLIADFPG